MLTRDNEHAADVFDALTRAEIPVEIVGLQGLLRLPEVAEVVATLTLLHDLTANAELLTLLTGPRWAVGAADLALLGRRARRAARVTEPRERERLRDLARGAAGRRRGRRPDRGGRRCPTRWATRASCTTPPGRAGAVRAAGRRAALPACARRRAAARPGPPDHRHLRHRRRAGLVGQPGGPGPAREPRPVRQGGRGVPGRSTARSRCRRCWPTSQAEDELGNGLDVATPVRGRLGQAAHRPPCQGAGVGRRVPGRGLPRAVPDAPPGTQWPNGHAVLPTPLRGDAADLPRARRGTAARTSTSSPTTRGRTTRPRSCGSGTSRSPAPARLLWVSSHVWRPQPAEAASARRTSSEWSAAPLPGLGRGRGGVAGAARRRSPTRSLDGRRAVAWPVTGQTAEVAAPAARRPGWVREAAERLDEPAAVEDDARPRGELAGRRVGRRARPAARRGGGGHGRRGRRTPAAVAVGHRGGPAPRRPRRVRPRPRAPDAAPALGLRPLRHPLPRLGRGPLRPAGPHRPRRAARARGRGDRRRQRPPAAGRAVRAGGRSPTGSRSRSSRRSRSCSTARWSAAASTRSTPSGWTARTATSSWTGRPTARRTPTRCSSRSTGVAWAELAGVPVERVRAAFYYVRTGDLVEPGAPGDARGARGPGGPADRPVLTMAHGPSAPWDDVDVRGHHGIGRTHDDPRRREDRRTDACPRRQRRLCRTGCRRWWTTSTPTASGATGTSGTPPGSAPATDASADGRQPTASIASSAMPTMSANVSWRSCAVVCSPVTMWSETVQTASARRRYLGRERVERAGLHLDGQHAVVRHPCGELGPRAVERVAGEDQPDLGRDVEVARGVRVVRRAEQLEVGDRGVVEALEPDPVHRRVGARARGDHQVPQRQVLASAPRRTRRARRCGRRTRRGARSRRSTARGAPCPTPAPRPARRGRCRCSRTSRAPRSSRSRPRGTSRRSSGRAAGRPAAGRTARSGPAPRRCGCSCAGRLSVRS